MSTHIQMDKAFEDLSKEEKMIILALYINYPIPQDTKQIRKTIKRYGWGKYSSLQLDDLRIELVKSKLN